MKKTISILIALVMIISAFSACGSKKEADLNSSSASGEVSADKEELKVGLVQLLEHTSLNEIRDAFTSELEALAEEQGITVSIDYKNAQNDMSLISSICRNFVEDKVDVIVAIATPTAQGAKTATKDIPIVFSAVTDPVAAGLLENFDAPEGNVTGVSDAIDISSIFGLAEELTPGIKEYGLIYNKGEVNSNSVISSVKEYLDGKGIAYSERIVTNSGEVQQATRALLETCDGIFVPIDNTVAGAMNALAKEAKDAKVPVYTAADSLVEDGGLATIGINYTELGKSTAQMTINILTGTPISELPVMVMSEGRPVVNKETAEAIGVSVDKYLD